MRLADIYRGGRFGLSIEVFPPKTADGDSALWDSIARLTRFRPDFVSVTYGAGGSTRSRTSDLCREIQARFGLGTTSHFTCVGGSKDELRDYLRLAKSAGIRNIMALRGDPPAGQTEFKMVEGGLRYANELVALIKSEFPNFGIGVAGYPEKHQEAPSLEVDMQNLARKVAAGADAVFTQLFFVNDNFLRFRDRCVQLGIRCPIVPGIMPITNFAQIKRITAMCGAVLPAELSQRLEAVQDDKEAQFKIGTEAAIEQCRELMNEGVPGMHFYALNRSQACETILDALQYRPAQQVA